MVYDRWVRLSVIVRVSLSVMLSSWSLSSATCTSGSTAICVKFLQIADVFDEFLVSCRTARGFLRKPGGCEPPRLCRAIFTLDGKLRAAVWILLGGLTVKTCIAYKAGW